MDSAPRSLRGISGTLVQYAKASLHWWWESFPSPKDKIHLLCDFESLILTQELEKNLILEIDIMEKQAYDD